MAGFPVGKAAEEEQRLGMLERRLHHRPAHELVDPAPLGRHLGDQVRAPAGILLDRELLEGQVLRMGKRKIDPEAFDDVVSRELSIGLADLPGQRGGQGVVRVGERRAAIDGSRELVEDDQLRKDTPWRVPDRVAEEALESFPGVSVRTTRAASEGCSGLRCFSRTVRSATSASPAASSGGRHRPPFAGGRARSPAPPQASVPRCRRTRRFSCQGRHPEFCETPSRTS